MDLSMKATVIGRAHWSFWSFDQKRKRISSARESRGQVSFLGSI